MKDINVYQKLEDVLNYIEKNSKKIILVSSVMIVGLVTAICALVSDDAKDVNVEVAKALSSPQTGVATMATPQEEQKAHSYYEVKIKPDTEMHIEPSLTSKHAATADGTSTATLITRVKNKEDEDFALISYKGENNSFERFGYVPFENVIPFDDSFGQTMLPANKYVRFNENVHIRSTKDKGKDTRNIVGKVQKGHYARVVAVDSMPDWDSGKKWSVILYHDSDGSYRMGYMYDVESHGQFLEEEQVAQLASQEYYTVTIAGDNVPVNVRSSTTTSVKNVIARLETGAVVVLLDNVQVNDEIWCKVQLGGQVGFIKYDDKYVKISKARYQLHGIEGLDLNLNPEQKTKAGR